MCSKEYPKEMHCFCACVTSLLHSRLESQLKAAKRAFYFLLRPRCGKRLPGSHNCFISQPRKHLLLECSGRSTAGSRFCFCGYRFFFARRGKILVVNSQIKTVPRPVHEVHSNIWVISAPMRNPVQISVARNLHKAPKLTYIRLFFCNEVKHFTWMKPVAWGSQWCWERLSILCCA